MPPPLEIERKFLVLDETWKATAQDPLTIRQAYIAREGRTAVRIRQRGDDYILTVKSEKDARTRVELEWEVSAAEGQVLFEDVVHLAPIQKTRWHVPNGPFVFEVDVFLGASDGLIVAEIELPNADAEFDRPPWLGPEVTEDRRFLNTYIAENPFGGWGIPYATLLQDKSSRS